jgi:NAD-dependent DNA ligase
MKLPDMAQSPVQERTAEELEKLIEFHDHQYFVLDDPRISDEEYDVLVRQLKKLRPDSPVLSRVGGQIPGREVFGDKVVHQRPMLSLDKCYLEKEFEDWLLMVGDELARLATEADPRLPPEYEAFGTAARGDFAAAEASGKSTRRSRLLPLCRRLPVVLTPKIDGLAVALRYDAGGSLVQGATRGSGVEGEDITINVRAVQGVPLRIASGPLEIRGEIHMTVEVFRSRYQDQFSNPRNLAAGTLRQKEGNRAQLLDLAFAAYDLLGEDCGTETRKMDRLTELGFQPVPYEKMPASGAVVRFEELAGQRDKWEYETDGLVVKLEDGRLPELLGVTAHHPRWAIAYKFQGDSGITTLLGVEWSVSRTGSITPVALLEPVLLSGAKISRCSLHNIPLFREKALRTGDQVRVTRRGGVIPNIEESLGGGETPLELPRKCPSCRAPTSLEAPQLFFAGFRTSRFPDDQELDALKRLADAQCLVLPVDSCEETTSRLARIQRKTATSAPGTSIRRFWAGDLRFLAELTWREGEAMSRRGEPAPDRSERDHCRERGSEQIASLPGLLWQDSRYYLLLVVDFASSASLDVLRRVSGWASRNQVSLRLVPVWDSLREGLELVEDEPVTYEQEQEEFSGDSSGGATKRVALRLLDAAREKRFAEALLPLLDIQGFGGKLVPGCTDEAALLSFRALASNLSEGVLTCSRPEQCPATQQGMLEYFVKTLGVDEFGGKLVETLYRAGTLRSRADFFRLTFESLVGQERVGEILARKLANNVQERRRIDLAVFLQSLGISDLAKVLAQELAVRAGSLEAVCTLREEDLVSPTASGITEGRQLSEGIPNVQFTTAFRIVQGLRREVAAIEELLDFVEIVNPAGTADTTDMGDFAGVLAGRSVVFTGKLARMTRKEAQAMARLRGARTPDDVTQDLDFLVIGDEGSPLYEGGSRGSKGAKGAKQKKAEAYIAGGSSIQIISETLFIEWCGNLPQEGTELP